MDEQGAENIPKGQACVLCANHQSTLDAFVFATLAEVNFKVTFKRELVFYPLIGQAMWLAGNIPVDRKDKESGKAAIQRSEECIRQGVSILFFPEGTRLLESADSPIGPFKAGAFKVAMDTKAPILPITLTGARACYPPKGFPSLGWTDIEMIVHKPIPTTALDPKNEEHFRQLQDATRAAIVSGLRPCDYYAGLAWEEQAEAFTRAFEANGRDAGKANAALGIVPAPVEAAPATEEAGGRTKKNN